MKKIKSSEITWYEDGSFAEWWENDNISQNSRKYEHYTLKETIEIARSNKILLVIQPMYQDEVIFVDYTEEC